MRTSLLAAGLVALALGGTAAIAHAVGEPGEAHTGRGGMPDLAALDADGDGTVTKQEFVDGMLDRMRERLEHRFERVDADGDGSVTVAELTAARTATMERFRQHRAACADGDATTPDATPATPDAGP